MVSTRTAMMAASTGTMVHHAHPVDRADYAAQSVISFPKDHSEGLSLTNAANALRSLIDVKLARGIRATRGRKLTNGSIHGARQRPSAAQNSREVLDRGCRMLASAWTGKDAGTL